MRAAASPALIAAYRRGADFPMAGPRPVRAGRARRAGTPRGRGPAAYLAPGRAGGTANVAAMTLDNAVAAFLAEPRNVVLAGTRADGRPHATPNWFHFDGELFYVSTTRDRVKYRIFTRDPRAQLLVDDPTAFRYLMIYGTVDVRADLAAELPRFRAIREKHSVDVQSDDELLAGLEAERRVLLAITPDGPPSTWTVRGFG